MKIRQWMKFFIISIQIILIMTNFDCENPPKNNCDFYDKCLNEKHKCEKGYAIEYGQKYCNRFKNTNFISQYTKKWRETTMLCLQKELIPLLHLKNATCEFIKEFAFDSHPYCYTKLNSICSFTNPLDIFTFAFIIDLSDLFSSR
jgi:hypothetical protein